MEVVWQLPTMSRKKIRSRGKSSSKSGPKAKASKGNAASQIKALQSKINKMHINTSPFATSGSVLGRSLGGMFGRSDLGSSLGGWLGSGIGKIFGSGAYRMSKNSVWSTADQCPSMHSTSETVIYVIGSTLEMSILRLVSLTKSTR